MSRSAAGHAQRREGRCLSLRRAIGRGHESNRRLVRFGIEVAADDRKISVVSRADPCEKLAHLMPARFSTLVILLQVRGGDAQDRAESIL